uniref:Replication-associated protein n=1 Tax=Emberiza rustica CRESS-DNA-virus sp. TaxID=2815032 RepID=A0A8A4XCB7_9VIRU|nr:MAG: replication-associated protein [Emberiza rustica CRESS-DNA-virus sp.]
MPENSVAVWDFTINDVENWPVEQVKEKLQTYCKKWTFQLEKVSHQHFQGRMSLKVRKSSPALVAKTLEVTWHFSKTSTAAKDDDFYCVKDDSRVAGPWKDTDLVFYIPRQYRGLEDRLRPFQQHIYDSRAVFEPRRVNVVYDPRGCSGKSTLASWMECIGVAVDMPPCNDGEKLISALCDICLATNNRKPGVVFVDLPRSMEQKKLYGLYTAIEQIKKGKLYDFRYSYKTFWIDSPQVWVFCNTMPSLNYMSHDRWCVYGLNSEWDLEKLSIREIKEILLSEDS